MDQIPKATGLQSPLKRGKVALKDLPGHEKVNALKLAAEEFASIGDENKESRDERLRELKDLKAQLDGDPSIGEEERFEYNYYYRTIVDLPSLDNFLRKNPDPKWQKLFVEFVMRDINSPDFFWPMQISIRLTEFLDSSCDVKDLQAIQLLNAKMAEKALQGGRKNRALKLAVRVNDEKLTADKKLTPSQHFAVGSIIYSTIDSDPTNFEQNYKILEEHFAKAAGNPEELKEINQFLDKHRYEVNPSIARLNAFFADLALKNDDKKRALELATRVNDAKLTPSQHFAVGSIIYSTIDLDREQFEQNYQKLKDHFTKAAGDPEGLKKINQFLEAHKADANPSIARLNAFFADLALKNGDKNRALALAVRVNNDAKLTPSDHFAIGSIIYSTIDSDPDNFDRNFKILEGHFAKAAENQNELQKIYGFLEAHTPDAKPSIARLNAFVADLAFRRADKKKALDLAVRVNDEKLTPSDHFAIGSIIYCTIDSDLTNFDRNFKILERHFAKAAENQNELQKIYGFLEAHTPDAKPSIARLNAFFADLALKNDDKKRALDLAVRINNEAKLTPSEHFAIGVILSSTIDSDPTNFAQNFQTFRDHCVKAAENQDELKSIDQFLEAHPADARLNAFFADLAFKKGDQKRAFALAVRVNKDAKLTPSEHFVVGVILSSTIDSDPTNFAQNFQTFRDHCIKAAEDKKELANIYQFLDEHKAEENPSIARLNAFFADLAFKKGELSRPVELALRTNPAFLGEEEKANMKEIVQAFISREKRNIESFDSSLSRMKDIAVRPEYLTPDQSYNYAVMLYTINFGSAPIRGLINNLLARAAQDIRKLEEIDAFLKKHTDDVFMHHLPANLARTAFEQKNIPGALFFARSANLQVLTAAEACDLGAIIQSQFSRRQGSREIKDFELMLDYYVAAVKKGNEKAEGLLKIVYHEVFDTAFSGKIGIGTKDPVTGKDILDQMVKLQRSAVSAASATKAYLRKLVKENDKIEEKISARIQLIKNINDSLAQPQQREIKVDPKSATLIEINAAFGKFHNDDIKNYATNSQKARRTDEEFLPIQFRKAFKEGWASNPAAVPVAPSPP